MTGSQKEQVHAANELFYAAFGAGDLDTMDRLWSKTRKVSIYHPNWQGISGREAVMRSWEAILGDGDKVDIRPVDPTIIMGRKSATVICEEHLASVRMIATNVFVREGADWKMVHHQATRLNDLPQSQPDGSAEKDQRSSGS